MNDTYGSAVVVADIRGVRLVREVLILLQVTEEYRICDRRVVDIGREEEVDEEEEGSTLDCTEYVPLIKPVADFSHFSGLAGLLRLLLATLTARLLSVALM